MLKHPTTKLGSIARIIMGQSPPGTTYNEVGEGLPFYQGVVDFGNRYPSRRVYCTAPTRIAEPGDILFSVRAPIGRVNIATEHCSIGRGLAVVRPHDPNDREFVEFVLCAGTSHLWDMFEGGGSVFGNARRDDLESLEIVWPAVQERRAIATILGALDDKIELNHQMNQTLEAMAQALFKNWFVDFEPFRDQGMEESKLGPIPRGWKAGELNNIANFVKGVSYRSDDLQESTVALVTLKSVARGGGYQQEGLKPYIGEYKPEQQLQPGEVIVAHTDLTQAAEVLGRAARVQAHPQFPTLVASLDLVIVRSVGYAASSEFLYSMFSRSEFQEHAYSYANGTTVLHLSIKALPEYQCVLPPSEVVDDFTRLVRPLYQCIDSNESQSQSLAAIRDTLLPKLLSGEIRIKEAEKFVEKAI